MDHSEAVQQMAAERYLLDELTPEIREEFEEHFFDCAACALDLRAGASFVDEAKTQLHGFPASSAATASPVAPRAARRKPRWSFWWQPAFAIPAFALLLAVIGYQNLATIPSLRSSAGEPRLVPWASVHLGTRGAAHVPVTADPRQGAVILIDTPQNSIYTSYAFELYDPQGKRFWTRTVPVTNESGSGGGTLSLFIPGSHLAQGPHTLAISGVTAQGERTRIEQRVLDIHFDEPK
jgi:hypothetical protein